MNLDFNAVILLTVAIMNGLTLFYTRRTEKNTNSMKDALVLSTYKEAHSDGMNEQRAKSELKAASLAQGVLQGQTIAQEKSSSTHS